MVELMSRTYQVDIIWSDDQFKDRSSPIVHTCNAIIQKPDFVSGRGTAIHLSVIERVSDPVKVIPILKSRWHSPSDTEGFRVWIADIEFDGARVGLDHLRAALLEENSGDGIFTDGVLVVTKFGAELRPILNDMGISQLVDKKLHLLSTRPLASEVQEVIGRMVDARVQPQPPETR